MGYVQNSNILGMLIARRIDLSEHQWLSEYLVARFPAATEANTTLPRTFVDAALPLRVSENAATHLFESHELTNEQFHHVATTAAPGTLRELVRTQRPPSAADLLTIIKRDARQNTDGYVNIATFALQNPEWTRYNELPKAEQRPVREMAHPDARFCWLSTKKTLDRHDMRNVLRWADELKDVTHAWGVHMFIESHHQNIDTLVALNHQTLNRALAMSRHLRDTALQRRMLHLDDAVTSLSDALAYYAETQEVLLPSVRNPSARLEVLQELLERIDILRARHGAPVGDYSYNLIRQTIELRLASTTWGKTVTQNYSEVADPELLKRLVSYATTLRNGYPTVFAARELLQNPLITERQKKSLGHILSDFEFAAPRPPADVRKKRQLDVARRLPLRGRSLNDYVQRLWDMEALPASHSKYFHEHLGENKAAWDAFFALGWDWGGTIDELVTTAVALT